MRWLALPFALPLAVGVAGCLWLPDIERHGYTACSDDADCPAGRACDIGLCAPPPWFSPEYGARTHLAVKNEGAEPFGADMAVPVKIGEGGVVPIGALGVTGRFLHPSRPDDGSEPVWTDVPTFRDIDSDFLYAWLPLPEGLAPGAETTLAWLYTQREDGEALLVEDPAAVFAAYDDFSPEGLVLVELDPEDYAWVGGDPVVENGVITLADNQQVTSRVELEPPFSLTVRGRINGNLCDSLFIGAIGADTAGSPPPYAGFYFQEGLQVSGDLAPTPDSTPAFISDPVDIDRPTARHRFEVRVEPGRVRLLIDGVLFDEKTEFRVRDPFDGDVPLFPTVDVDGNCTFELEGWWVTRGPFTSASVRAEPQVLYREVP